MDHKLGMDALIECALKTISPFLLILDISGKILYSNRSIISRSSVEGPADSDQFSIDPIFDKEELESIITSTLEHGCFNRIVSLNIPGEEPGRFESESRILEFETGGIRAITLLLRKLPVKAPGQGPDKLEKGLLNRISDQVYDSIVVSDLDYNIVYLNESAENLYGYSIEEILGQKTTIFLASEMDPGIQKEGELQVFTGESWTGVMENRRKDGSTFFCHLKVVPMNDALGNPAYLVGFQRDITQQILSERNLRKSEEKYRNLVEQSNDGICIVESCIVKFANRQFLKLLEMPADEIIGKRIYDYICKVDDTMCDRCKAVTASNQISKSTIKMIKSSKGKETHIDISMIPFSYENSKAVMMIIHDITHKKELEQEIVKSQKFESIGLMAGGIAHDFNNYLSGIMGYISLARMMTGRNSEQAEAFTKAEKACTAARNLTHQLLTFSTHNPLEIEPISLDTIIEESINLVSGSIHSGCTLNIKNGLGTARVDPVQITQVVHNLILNADQAMPDGGNITVAGKLITVTETDYLPLEPGIYAEITFRDQGSGINLDNSTRIFDPYFSTKENGRGLGLSTTYSIMKNHGGHIRYETEKNVGTTFFIYLPILGESGESSENRLQNTKQEIPNAGRILLLDDEEMLRDSTMLMLEEIGFQTIGVEDGDAAVEAYSHALKKENPFDLVILDLTLPRGMDGLETLSALKSIDPDVRAVITSGYSSSPVITAFQEHGFCGYLKKPYTLDQLESLMTSLIK